MTNKVLIRSTPEELMISPEGLDVFIRQMDESDQDFHSVMLLRHGKVAAEKWWPPHAPEEQHILNSLSKSFTSTAVGIAVDEGFIKISDRVASFFPEDLPQDINRYLAAMTVRDLLMMSAGQEKEIWPEEGMHWTRAFLANQPTARPGTVFLYNTLATYMLSAIVQKASGFTLTRFLKPRLFEPLGITGMIWEQSPQGIDKGGFGLYLKTEDIAKFGQLYLQKGIWNGKRLLSHEWVEAATSKQIETGLMPGNDWKMGYGYQFWQCRHGFYRGDGANGQFCIVMAEYDAVLAVTAHSKKMETAMNLAWEFLLPAFR
jgi:CubicO group peptidase (beta-lactamase class C family)